MRSITSASIPQARPFGVAPFSLTPSHQTAEVTRSLSLPGNWKVYAIDKNAHRQIRVVRTSTLR
jgi:hypothetical protein